MRISDWSSDVCSSDLPLLSLHGFPSASHMFRDLITQLADEFDVIAPDLSGFGQSDMPSRKKFDYTLEIVRMSWTLYRGCLHQSFRDLLGLVRVLDDRSEEHTSELQSLMRISYAVFCLKKTKHTKTRQRH